MQMIHFFFLLQVDYHMDGLFLKNTVLKLKYIAMYEVAPISSIRWAGKIQSIKPFEDTPKYKIYCSEIFKVGPIELDTPKVVPQASRYTKFDLIAKAKKLSDIF